MSHSASACLFADLEGSPGLKLFTHTEHDLESSVEARRFHQRVESMFRAGPGLRPYVPLLLAFIP